MCLRLANVSLLVAFVVLFHRLWLGDGGYAEMAALEQELLNKRQEVKRLHDRNQALAAEVADLKTGLGALEELARSDLGMVGKGEVFFQILSSSDVNEE